VWIPAIKVGDKKWLLCTESNRKIFLKFVESAILCDEVTDESGGTSIVFSSNNREKNSELVQPYIKWFGVHTDLKRQYEITSKNLEVAAKMAGAGIRGVVMGDKDGGGVSH
jgi:hypothetical protein